MRLACFYVVPIDRYMDGWMDGWMDSFEEELLLLLLAGSFVGE